MQKFIHCPETQLCSHRLGGCGLMSEAHTENVQSWADVKSTKRPPGWTIWEQNVQRSQDTWVLVFRVRFIAQMAQRDRGCSEVGYWRGEGLTHTHEEILEDLGPLLLEILTADYPESRCAQEELTSRGQGWVQRAVVTGLWSPKCIRKNFLLAGNVFPSESHVLDKG